MNVVIYGSQYGTAKEYADELARRTGMEERSWQEITSLDGYDTIVYIGALYAGGVLGMKKTFQAMQDCTGKNIVLATVGLADPKDAENVKNIRAHMKQQLPECVYRNAHIVHLRGGIDYSGLNLKHKAMMGLLYRKAIRLPEEKKTAEVKAMIETYGRKVDFVEPDSLNEIIALIK